MYPINHLLAIETHGIQFFHMFIIHFPTNDFGVYTGGPDLVIGVPLS